MFKDLVIDLKKHKKAAEKLYEKFHEEQSVLIKKHDEMWNDPDVGLSDDDMADQEIADENCLIAGTIVDNIENLVDDIEYFIEEGELE